MSERALAYRIIAPLPFGVVHKNYIKLQVLPETNDLPADSAIFDVYYNGGKLSIPLDRSFSYVLRLNEFNDGVFFVQARVYQQGRMMLLGSKYDQSGIPVVLDRHTEFNQTQFTATYLNDRKVLNETQFLNDRISDDQSRSDAQLLYQVEGNNNRMSFAPYWDDDSLYFRIEVADANINYKEPSRWDLFQAKDYLQVLWNSDCIELGMDLHHDRSEWKQVDDVEFLVDVKGNTAGNRWSAVDSIYEHWGTHTRTHVSYRGTMNNNQDIDSGYLVIIAISWGELQVTPNTDMPIGFDLQLYDKDADLDEAFRTSVSGTNPESNDNTSEWTTIVLQPRPTHALSYALFAGLGLGAAGIVAFFSMRRIKKGTGNTIAISRAGSVDDTATPPTSYSSQTDAALQYIALRYNEPELSRQEIADHVALTEKYLSTLFKKEVGVNLVSYINKFRIERSEELLRASKLPVSEVAFKVGFNSLQNFNKNFRLITGKTPSDYRKS